MKKAACSPQNEKRVRLFGVDISSVSREEALNQIQCLMNKKRQSLFFINAHCLNQSLSDWQYREALNSASLLLPDGVGVEMASRMTGQKIASNLNGTDMFPHLCALFAAQAKRVFLLGASPGTAERVAEWMKQEYPTLEVVGVHHGFLDSTSSQNVIKKINQCRAEVLFVAMGVPMQENWIHRHAAELNTSINIAVGGLFEFYSMNIPRAPVLVRKCKCEWAWRLLQEPSRLWRRYLLESLTFFSRVVTYGKGPDNHEACTVSSSFWLTWLRRHRLPLLRAQHLLKSSCNRLSKRALDIVVAGSMLCLLLPFFLIVACLIKCESPGPVFFRQQRVGEQGRPFSMIKFRTMSNDAEAQLEGVLHLNEKKGGVMFKIENDPRVTRLGTYLRRYSIDELPQLWNVVTGSMSLVGPRPGLYRELAEYRCTQRQRLRLKPGLTSEWVSAGRNLLSFEEQAELDKEYYFKQSFWYDIRLLLLTLPAIIKGRGAS